MQAWMQSLVKKMGHDKTCASRLTYLALWRRIRTQNQQAGEQVCVSPHFLCGLSLWREEHKSTAPVTAFSPCDEEARLHQLHLQQPESVCLHVRMLCGVSVCVRCVSVCVRPVCTRALWLQWAPCPTVMGGVYSHAHTHTRTNAHTHTKNTHKCLYFCLSEDTNWHNAFPKLLTLILTIQTKCLTLTLT